MNRTMDFDEYQIARHDSLPGCCVVPHKFENIEEYAEIDRLTDRYKMNPITVSLINARSISDIMRCGIATFAKDIEEFAKISGLMKPCFKVLACNYYNYTLQQSENVEKIKFLARCLLDGVYLINSSDYINQVYAIELMQAMEYNRLAYSALKNHGGNVKEEIKSMKIGKNMQNELTVEIAEDLIQEIKNRSELCKK